MWPRLDSNLPDLARTTTNRGLCTKHWTPSGASSLTSTSTKMWVLFHFSTFGVTTSEYFNHSIIALLTDFLQAIWTILNKLTMEYWKINVATFPSRQSIFPSELLKLTWQSPQKVNTGKYCPNHEVNTRKYWTAHEVNTRKYCKLR